MEQFKKELLIEIEKFLKVVRQIDKKYNNETDIISIIKNKDLGKYMVATSSVDDLKQVQEL